MQRKNTEKLLEIRKRLRDQTVQTLIPGRVWIECDPDDRELKIVLTHWCKKKKEAKSKAYLLNDNTLKSLSEFFLIYAIDKEENERQLDIVSEVLGSEATQ